LNSRGSNTDKDEDFVNVYPEIIKNRNTKENEIYLVKRSGSTQFIASVGASSIRGMHYWEDQAQLFVAVSDDIYIYNAITGALLTTLSAAFGTTTGVVGFCEYLYDTGVVKVVATDGTTLMTIDSAGTKVVGSSMDMPVHLPYPIFLDGYLFILAAGTADLWNSNLNDPLLYTAGDFITAEMFADRATYLVKLNNYILVFGNKSIEYFWDAANPTGSPLQRNDTPVKLTGFHGGVAAIGNKVFFVGSNDDSQPDIFVVEDFKLQAIGTEAIRRHLASISIASVTTINAAIVSQNGHDFYVFDTGSGSYCYDPESKLWSRWIYQTGTRFALTHAVNVETTSGYKTLFALEGASTIYRMSPTLYQDNGTTFAVVVVTDNEEFDTYNQKFMHRLTVWADKPSDTATGTLQWTDDDYQNYSSGHTIDLYQELPATYQLGRFRRRAFKWTFTQNQPHRLKGFEVDINMGQT
jgi:hypothetical protein